MMNYLTVPIRRFRSIINKGHSRSINIVKNIFASFFIRGCSIAISLVLVPLTINYVNPTQYGIWLTLSSIIGWFGFFDIGFGNGLRNKFAEALAKEDKEQARIYVSTTYAILSIIIAVVLLLFFCINPFLNWATILNAPAAMGDELRTLALIVFVFFCIQFVLQLITTIITANQQPAKASAFNLLGSVFSLVVIYTLTRTTSGNLLYLGLALGFAPILVLAVSTFWFFRTEYRWCEPSVKHVKFRYARDLMNLGFKFFIIQIAFVVLYQTDNIIIAQLFGPTEVTPYNIAYKYFGVIPMLFGIIITPFWSAFTESWIKQDLSWIRSTMKKLRLFWLLLCAVALVMLLSAGFVYGIWIGDAVLIPFSMSSVMAIYVLVNAWNGIYSQFLNGVGKIKIQLYASIFGVLLNIPVALLLGKAIGVSGVVLANVLFGVINMIWSAIQYQKIIQNKASGLWDK